MILLESTASMIILGAALLLHIGTQFSCRIIAKILAFVNITLHIVLIGALLFDRVPIDEAVLAYTASVFVYTLLSYVRHLLSMNRGEENV